MKARTMRGRVRPKRLYLALALLPCAALLMGIDCHGGGDGPLFPADLCTCYQHADCGDGAICGVDGCDPQGKLDGTCHGLLGGGTNGSPPETMSSSNRAAETVNLIFQAYEAAVAADDGGRADQAIWDQVYATAVSHEWALVLIRLSHYALDATLGFDFLFVPPEYANVTSDSRGNIRGGPHEAIAMLRATRDSLIAGLLARDAAAANGPLDEFWRTHPDYRPDHTGRCYPHGHHLLENVDPRICQQDYMSRALGQVVPLLAP